MKAVLLAVLLGVGLVAGASKCESERDAPSHGLLGVFRPNCDSDGRYHHTQCMESTCFCVNQDTGKAVAGTSGTIAELAQIEAKCGSKCEQERAKAVTSGLLGAHAPECDNGKYHPTQCREAVCFCVDTETGVAKEGTEGPVGQRSEIEKKCNKSPSKCESERDASISSGLLGVFRPNCEQDGRYHHTQCVESMCFCVNQDTGKAVPGTSGTIAEMAQIEAKCGSKCEQERATALTSGLIGAHAPQCDNGKYHHTQCHESVCSCVNQDTGVIVPGTSGPVSDLKQIEAQCGSKCEQERAKALTSGLIGAHAPQCDNGKYHATQCRESVCFCVNPDTGAVIDGTQGSVGQKAEIEKKCSKPSKRGVSKCEQERDSATGLGAYKPKCESNGKYHYVQCVGSVCYCADQETGTKKQGSEASISAIDLLETACKPPQIQYASASCSDAQQAALKNHQIGRSVPRCTLDGNYYAMQCQESVCFCVDRQTGAKQQGTEDNIGNIKNVEKKCADLAGTRVAGPCELEAMEANQQSHLLGRFVPRCETSNGRYYPMQCRESVCYCVDRLTGGKLAGTQGPISKRSEIEQKCQSSNGPILAMFSAGRPKKVCEVEREKASHTHGLGQFVPVCDSNGRFELAQCFESYCHCVDPLTGSQKDGSQKRGIKREDMQKECKRQMSVCERERFDSNDGMGAYVPSCEADGSYTRHQCHGSVCFCVDRDDGTKLDGTEGPISDFARVTAKCQQTECQRQAQKSSGMLGAFRPRCDRDHGNFMAVQCHESECFCVNRITGEKTKESGHISQLGELHDKCMTDCEKKRDTKAPMMRMGGEEPPRCDVDGDYRRVQCQEAVCECVNANGKPRPGTEKNVGFYRQLERQCPGGGKQCKEVKPVLFRESCPAECTAITMYGRLGVYCCCA